MGDDTPDVVEIDQDPTPREEADETFSNQEDRARRLRNDSDEQDIGERKRYADYAYGITQAWLGFLIVIILAQFSLKPLKMGLETPEFITVVTTTTASIFGFWLLVGQYLFRGRGDR